MGGSGSGLAPFFKNTSFSAKVGELYLTDVSNQSIIVDMSKTLKKDSTSGLYSVDLKSGDYFEIFIVNGNSSQNTVTVSFSTIQNTPYNVTEKLEGQSGSDFIFDSNSYFRFTYVNDSIGWKINSMSGSVPNDGIIGSIMPFAGFTSPSGYFFTDGSSKSRTDYEELFNILTYKTLGTLASGTKNITVASTSNLYIGERIEGVGILDGTTITSITDSTHFAMSNNATITGTTSILVLPYGSVSTTTFNLPNLCGKTPFGVANTDSKFKLGMSGGTSSKTLGVNEIPNHSHTYQYPNDWTGKIGGWADTNETVKAGGSYDRTTSSIGGGQAFSLLNPYLSLNFIIKY